MNISLKQLYFGIIVILFSLANEGGAQELYYPLSDDFSEETNLHSDLIPLSNPSGDDGYFGSFTVPSTTCPNEFEVDGYYFYEDAGLQFNNESFITCDYSIQFTFQLDNVTGYNRLINFNTGIDAGIYLLSGTLNFYPNGNIGTPGFFNTVDLYQFTITRNCAGLVNVYVNGTFFTSYDDSASPLYLVQNPDNLIVFFQDNITGPANGEASSGWVKNIIIANYVWPITTVEDDWDDFCDDLIDQSCLDCAGEINGTAVLDSCGICLEPTDPNFNTDSQVCTDCNGVLFGNAVIDS
ncbi:MAG: hypothetical protein V3V14_12450, partial [Saprospiraceae bacterium]